MQFDLIRLMLVSRAQTSLLEEKDELGKSLSREEWLRKIFSRQIEFKRGKNDYYFIQSATDDATPNIISGQICRQFSVKENLPPERGLTEIERLPWRATNVFIDPTHHADGQKLAFQEKDHFDSAVAIIKDLTKQINSNHHEPYIIEANAIVDPTTFWDFEKENRGKIVSITFEFVAPNMFGIRDEIDKEMSEFKEKEKARTVSLTLKNSDGLRLDDERVVESVNHATDGGGSITARTKGSRKSFNSNKNAKKETIDDDNIVDKNSISSILHAAVDIIFGRSG